jgi:hypothetical protein
LPAESSSLFRLVIARRFRRSEVAALEDHATVGLAPLCARDNRLSNRWGGLLSVADAGWAYTISVAGLIGFVVVGFGAITTRATEQPDTVA